MKFRDLLALVGDEPVFESSVLLAGETTPASVYRTLSRWTNAGRLLQLRRGLYTLAPEYRRAEPHPFLVANRLDHSSYVSLQSALAYHGVVPEHVATTTSVTTRRPRVWRTPLGAFSYRHVKRSAFFGHEIVGVAPAQQAAVAVPEKALIDLLYLEPGSSRRAYLHELRLDTTSLDWTTALDLSARLGSRKVAAAIEMLRGGAPPRRRAAQSTAR